MSKYAPTGEDGDMPCFDIFVKSSTIDPSKIGSCPICQQYLLLSYHLGGKDAARFNVVTINTQRPLPEWFKKKTRGKSFPVIVGLSGKDAGRQDITDLVADSFDEVEKFFEIIDEKCPLLKSQDQKCQLAMAQCDNLYKNFNLFIQSKNDKPLVKDLRNIDNYLGVQGTTFMCGDSELSFADCYLMPRLQHIRVVGEEYNFEIPDDLNNLRAYMTAMYQTEEYLLSMASDQDIKVHFHAKYQQPQVQRQRSVEGEITLQAMKYTTTF